MGVHGHGWLPKSSIEYHIGRLAADTRQGFQVLMILADLVLNNPIVRMYVFNPLIPRASIASGVLATA
jgi:hypothetical protein